MSQCLAVGSSVNFFIQTPDDEKMLAQFQLILAGSIFWGFGIRFV